MEAESWLAKCKICNNPDEFWSPRSWFRGRFYENISFLNSIYKKIAKIHENLSQQTTATAKRDPTQVIIGFILVPYLLNC